MLNMWYVWKTCSSYPERLCFAASSPTQNKKSTEDRLNKNHMCEIVKWVWKFKWYESFTTVCWRVKLPVQEASYPLCSQQSIAYDEIPLITVLQCNTYLAFKILIKFCSPLWSASCKQKSAHCITAAAAAAADSMDMKWTAHELHLSH